MMGMLGLIPILFILSFGCSGDSDPKPKALHLGEDVCQRCKMIISDERFAAELVYGGGRVEKFDDVGCMMHFLHDLKGAGEGGLPGVFVKDYYTGEWVPGRGAYYVVSERLRTPMGHGVAALSSKEAAGRLIGEVSGEKLMDLEGASGWVLKRPNPVPDSGGQ